MAKETRQRKSAGANRKPAKSANGKAKSRPAAKTSSGRRVATRGVAKPAARATAKTAKPPAKRDTPAPRAVRAPEPAPAPPPAPRKPGYYEALAMYENGVRALQRHDYPGAATQFRTIMERYPEERELQERSHLYLRVCERETARRPATPQTPAGAGLRRDRRPECRRYQRGARSPDASAVRFPGKRPRALHHVGRAGVEGGRHARRWITCAGPSR